MRFQLGGVDANGIVARVTDLGLSLAGGFHVSTDATVPQKLGGRAQDSSHGRPAVDDVLVYTEKPAGLLREADLLSLTEIDSPSLADGRRVVVGPGRSRKLKEALPFFIGSLRVRLWIDEDVAVIERGHEPDRSAQKHPVAEDVTAHVSDSHDGDGARSYVLLELAEVALYALPHATCRDRFLLVVVSMRSARSESVASPEVVLRRNRVRFI